MGESSVITIRLARGLRDQLDALALSTKRSKSFLAAQAIESFVEQNAWQVFEIEKGVREAEAGDFASPDEVESVFTKWSE